MFFFFRPLSSLCLHVISVAPTVSYPKLWEGDETCSVMFALSWTPVKFLSIRYITLVLNPMYFAGYEWRQTGLTNCSWTTFLSPCRKEIGSKIYNCCGSQPLEALCQLHVIRFSRINSEIRLFPAASGLTVGLTQPPNEWFPDALSLGMKHRSRETNHSLSSNVEEKKEWSYTSTFLHA